ncbi:MAG: hypothetical protein FD156_1124 [Nitrospirae bacterium]|nr:MAG: hypothetical protein FD156_1124 [Nitrospirota bacterium]
MPEDKKQIKKNSSMCLEGNQPIAKKKGYKPLPNDLNTFGNIPTHGTLDDEVPPTGGSGVPSDDTHDKE